MTDATRLDQPGPQASAGSDHDVLLRARGLTKRFGDFVAVDGIDVEVHKGQGIRRLLRGAQLDAALYMGDDTTDLDAFRGLRALRDEGRLGGAVCIGVRSEETPPELEQESDLLVDGPTGVRRVLEALL